MKKDKIPIFLIFLEIILFTIFYSKFLNTRYLSKKSTQIRKQKNAINDNKEYIKILIFFFYI